MDRSSIIVKGARLVQHLPLFLLRPVEWPLVRLAGHKRKKPSLIILLALPRSGSTLTYQILSHGLKSVYLSNLGNLLYQLPYLGGLLSSHYCANSESTFRSSQGFVRGLCGPAEGLRFWQYWFANGIDERLHRERDTAHMRRRANYLRKAIIALGSEERPVVTGYLGHPLRLEQLQSTFPEAVFIRLHRDPLHNAISLLRCRQKSDAEWFSVYPVECERHADESVHGQVAAQVYWLNSRLSELKGERVIHISYEDLCRNPAGSLQSIVTFCNALGMRLEHGQALPKSFDMGGLDENSREDVNIIREHLGKLESQYGHLK